MCVRKECAQLDSWKGVVPLLLSARLTGDTWPHIHVEDISPASQGESQRGSLISSGSPVSVVALRSHLRSQAIASMTVQPAADIKIEIEQKRSFLQTTSVKT